MSNVETINIDRCSGLMLHRFHEQPYQVCLGSHKIITENLEFEDNIVSSVDDILLNIKDANENKNLEPDNSQLFYITRKYKDFDEKLLDYEEIDKNLKFLACLGNYSFISTQNIFKCEGIYFEEIKTYHSENNSLKEDSKDQLEVSDIDNTSQNLDTETFSISDNVKNYWDQRNNYLNYKFISNFSKDVVKSSKLATTQIFKASCQTIQDFESPKNFGIVVYNRMKDISQRMNKISLKGYSLVEKMIDFFPFK